MNHSARQPHPNILRSLAAVYEKSTSARKNAARDFVIDYEKFLRTCDMADGDDREIAERELRRAESSSGGLLRIDCHLRTGHAERIRLVRDGGETWLFAQIDDVAPSVQRAELSQTFLAHADESVPAPWQQNWSAWFRQLAEQALAGESIQPFRRDDAPGNQALLIALRGILHWSSPALIRYASTAICGDSKQLQRLEPRLRLALHAITGSDSLETFGILRKPRFVTFHGPLTLRIGTQQTDFAMFPGPVTLAETNFTDQATLSTQASICLTVENEDTFHELAATNPGVLLILTSYAGAAVRRMMRLLPSELTCFHFGDSDPAGADILRDLREKTGRDIRPLLLPGQQNAARQALAQNQRQTLHRLLDSDLPAELRAHAEVLLENGIPNDYEQESIPIAQVWEALRMSASDQPISPIFG
jgi:hypothetical protein